MIEKNLFERVMGNEYEEECNRSGRKAEKRRDALEDSGGKKMNVGEARNADEKPRGYAEQ